MIWRLIFLVSITSFVYVILESSVVVFLVAAWFVSTVFSLVIEMFIFHEEEAMHRIWPEEPKESATDRFKKCRKEVYNKLILLSTVAHI